MTDAAKDFLRVLDCVEHLGETAVIVRDGKRVATISPLPSPALTCAELADRWSHLERLTPDKPMLSLMTLSMPMPASFPSGRHGIDPGQFDSHISRNDDRRARSADCSHGLVLGARGRHSQRLGIQPRFWSDCSRRDPVSTPISSFRASVRGILFPFRSRVQSAHQFPRGYLAGGGGLVQITIGQA
jgi:antitoxin (DNA-binding transcriptional repressor) of toxin-antitoxin stability system